jgi:hypothetical protein
MKVSLLLISIAHLMKIYAHECSKARHYPRISSLDGTFDLIHVAFHSSNPENRMRFLSELGLGTWLDTAPH